MVFVVDQEDGIHLSWGSRKLVCESVRWEDCGYGRMEPGYQ